MKIVVYGATGKSGSRIVTELLSRGHSVIAGVRGNGEVPSNVTTRQDDLSDVSVIAATIQGADAVISAYAPPQDDTDALIGVTERQIAAVKQAGAIRLLVVGGAGSLEVAPGVTLLKSGYLPEAFIPISESHEKALNILKDSDINWTYLSPAAMFEPGQRTSEFRLGHNELISGANQASRISMEDYAIAIVDELEKPAHEKARFSIGY